MCNKTVGNQRASGFHLKIYSEFAVLALLIKDNLKVYANLKSLYHKVIFPASTDGDSTGKSTT